MKGAPTALLSHQFSTFSAEAQAPPRLALGARTRGGIRVLGASGRVRAELSTTDTVSDTSSEMGLK